MAGATSSRLTFSLTILLLVGLSSAAGRLSHIVGADDARQAFRTEQLAHLLTQQPTEAAFSRDLKDSSVSMPACVWWSGFGYLNCMPQQSQIPKSVVNSIGKKGSILKPYYQLVRKCADATDYENCPDGCQPDGVGCGAPNIYSFLACKGSLAKSVVTCSSAGSKEACNAAIENGIDCLWNDYETVPLPDSNWTTLIDSSNTTEGYCSVDSSQIQDPAVYNAIIYSGSYEGDASYLAPVTDKAVWKKAFGSCRSSLYLFDRQVCSSTFDITRTLGKADCKKFKQCEWVDDGKGVFKGCIRRKSALTTILYGGDAALSAWANKCLQYDAKPEECQK